VPSEVRKVDANLRVLSLSRNMLAAVPTFLSIFRSLKSLNLSHNRIGACCVRCCFVFYIKKFFFIPVTLPDELKVLERIETLDISYVRA
jgi:hypothetical protein